MWNVAQKASANTEMRKCLTLLENLGRKEETDLTRTQWESLAK